MDMFHFIEGIPLSLSSLYVKELRLQDFDEANNHFHFPIDQLKIYSKWQDDGDLEQNVETHLPCNFDAE